MTDDDIKAFWEGAAGRNRAARKLAEVLRDIADRAGPGALEKAADRAIAAIDADYRAQAS